MKKHKSWVVFISSLLLIVFSTAEASPDSLSYQGKIAKSDGTPLEHSSVSFIFEITSHDGACVLFREKRGGINMANSKGVFDVPIGLGTRSFPTSGTYKFSDVFNNSISHACDGGGTYSPAVSAERRLRVQFWDGTGWQLISPDNVIRSVPFAVQSTNSVKFADKPLSEFVLKSVLPGCAANEFLTWDGAGFNCIAVPTVSGVVMTSDPRLTDSRVPTGSAGGDLSGTFPQPTVSHLQGRAVSSAAPTNNQVLKWNGTAWAPANDEGGSGGGGVSSVDLSVPSIMSVSGGPVTSSGNLLVSLNSQSAATVFAAPAAANGVPTFRSLLMADIKSSIGGFNFLSTTSACTTGKALVYVSASDRLECQALAFDASAITSGTIHPDRLPAGANPWTAVTDGLNYGAGNVGVGKPSPNTKLDVAGGIRLADDADACDSSKAGTMKYVSSNLFVCNGLSWKMVRLVDAEANVVLVGGTGTNMNVVGPGNPAYGDPVIFTYQNIGAANTEVITTSLSSSSNFEIVADTCNGQVLTPSSSCAVTVISKTNAEGSFSANLVVNW